MKPFWMPDTQGFLAIAIVGIVGGVMVLLLAHPVTLDDKITSVLQVMLGVLLGSFKDVYSFFFGSSKGSEKKDDALISGSITTTAPVAPVVVPPASSGTIIKSLAFITVLATAVLVMGSGAFAQSPKLTGNLAKDFQIGTSAQSEPKLGKDLQALWEKIMAASTVDLQYASAMAGRSATPASKVRKQCWDAIVALNKQITDPVKDDQGNVIPRPDPHLFTDVESLAETIDNLSPQGPLFTSCAGAAEMAKMNTLQFVATVVSGASGLAALGVAIP